MKKSEILAFDIETIPDVNGIRLIYDLSSDLCDDDVLDFALHKLRVKNGSEFMPLHLHKIVCISCFSRFKDGTFKLGTIGKIDGDEKSIITDFFNIIDNHIPVLVSWNGVGFDLPVLNYRSLIYGINAYKYWQMDSKNGDYTDNFKYNNYINRYHLRHIDLMDLLSLYQFNARCSLDDMAKLCGLPGKIGMDGSAVLQEYNKGNILCIMNYCEIDALNTYLLYLRFDLVRGLINLNQYNEQKNNIYNYLISNNDNNHQHLVEFCNNWDKNK